MRRVAAYALVIADAMGLRRGDTGVERVALFHDIGKIHEALFDIVHDDAELSREPSAARSRPTRSAARKFWLRSARFTRVPDGTCCHHERWDGTGYPRDSGQTDPARGAHRLDRRHVRRRGPHAPLPARRRIRARVRSASRRDGDAVRPDSSISRCLPPSVRRDSSDTRVERSSSRKACGRPARRAANPCPTSAFAGDPNHLPRVESAAARRPRANPTPGALRLSRDRVACEIRAEFVVAVGNATKYSYGTFAGYSAASMLGRPGDAIGPGGSPLLLVRVVRRIDLEILVVDARDVFAERVLHRGVGLQEHAAVVGD